MTTLDRVIASGYRLVVDEQFDGDDLDPTRWIPYYLPQWTGRERAAARYRVGDGRLELRIDADQPAWAPGLEGTMRVSSLQTGVVAGPLGSTVGQHRVHPDAVVVEEQHSALLLAAQYAVVELRASWSPHPDRMVALWMIGVEDEPQRSAEICVCEIFGTDVEDESCAVGMGVHPFGDPTIVDQFGKVRVGIDVRRPHDYACVWTPDDVTFFVDGEIVESVTQSPGYPMQFMLGIYDFGPLDAPPTTEPFVVESFRVHFPV